MTTRAERITDYLHEYLGSEIYDHPDFSVEEILAIADDRTLLTVGDFAAQLGRPVPTILSWIARGQHDMPSQLYPTRPGRQRQVLLFDEDEVHAWIEAHAEQRGETATYAVPDA